MAAVIARVICAPCKAIGPCCDGIDKCCVSCSKACGRCCTSFCKCFGEACSCCTKGCDGFFQWVEQTFDKPLSCCVLFTVLLGGVPGVASVLIALTSFDKHTCANPVTMWLLLQSLTFFANLLCAIYLYRKFRAPYNRADRRDRDFYARMSRLLCDDPGIAVYILVAIFMLVWQIVGQGWIQNANSTGCAQDPLITMLDVALAVQWIYMVGGGCLFAANMMHAWCQTRCCPAFLNTPPFGCLIMSFCPCCVPSEPKEDSMERGHHVVAGQAGYAAPVSAVPVPAQSQHAYAAPAPAPAYHAPAPTPAPAYHATPVPVAAAAPAGVGYGAPVPVGGAAPAPSAPPAPPARATAPADDGGGGGGAASVAAAAGRGAAHLMVGGLRGLGSLAKKAAHSDKSRK